MSLYKDVNEHWTLEIGPRVEKALRWFFYGVGQEAAEEARADCMARAWSWFAKSWERGVVDKVSPTRLAELSAKHYRNGRRFGTSSNVNELFHLPRIVASIDDFEKPRGGPIEILDWDANPADIVSAKDNLETWVVSLPRREQELVYLRCSGLNQRECARVMGLTDGRISQLMSDLRVSWAIWDME